MEEGGTGSRKKSVNVEYIQEKLCEGYRYTNAAKGRDLVLVIGNTGVGKSTTCNYLLGYEMKENVHNGRTVIETVEETNVKIGHKIEAETLYANTVVSNNNMCFVDCPGFLGNRTVEDSVIESISIELTIRNAKEIKGVLILISINVLMEARLTELRGLIKTVVSLFKDPVEMVQYSIIIITKKNKYMPENEARSLTLGTLRSLKDHCKSEARKYHENQKLSSSEGLTYTDYDKIATYFSAILERPDDIVFVNPLDAGECRQLIFDRINGIEPRKGYLAQFANAGYAFAKKAAKKAIGADTKKEAETCPITIDDFNFSEYDEHRTSFNQAMYDSAHDGHQLLKRITSAAEESLILHREISGLESRLSTQKQLLLDLGEEVFKTNEDESSNLRINIKSIENLKSMVTENSKYKKVIESDIEQNELKLQELKEELKSIDTDKALMFLKKSIDVDVSWWKAFGWEEMEFNANTGDSSIEIIKVEKGKENGQWVDEVDERHEGIYAIKYVSQYHAKPAKANVNTYIRTKDERGNRIRIKQINEEIEKLNKKITSLKSQIEDIVSRNSTLLLTIKQAESSKEDYTRNLKQKLKDCEKDILHDTSKVANMQQEMEKLKCSGLTDLQEFYKNQHKYDIIDNIAAVLEFPSLLVKKFVAEYKKFLTDVQSYSSVFEEGNVNLDSFPFEKESEGTVELKDPITGGRIKKLVVTPAGTAFDCDSLLKQFQNSKEPFLFKRDDDSVEEIGYLSWFAMPDLQSCLDYQRNQKSCPPSSSALYLTTKELDHMTSEQLEEQKGELSKDIQSLKEQLLIKETQLEKICRRLDNTRIEC